MNPEDVLRIEAAMQAMLDEHLDDHARKLAQAWARAWVDVSAEVEASLLGLVADGNVDTAIALDPARTRAALAVIEKNLDDLAAYTADQLTGSLESVVRLGVDGQIGMYQAQGETTFNRADNEQINAMVDRSTQQITALSRPLAEETRAAIARRLNRGVALGDNPRLVAEQIMKDCEGHMNMSLARALNISRTEMLDAMRNAQYVTDLGNTAILRGWVWIAHLDSKTCGSCIAMHGTEFPVEEEGPLDHHSGRCGRMPVTKSWSELGFTGITGTSPVIPDAADWFDSLDEIEQRSILTNRGYEAWKAGNFPMSSWSVRKENPDWRAAYFMAKPPKG